MKMMIHTLATFDNTLHTISIGIVSKATVILSRFGVVRFECNFFVDSSPVIFLCFEVIGFNANLLLFSNHDPNGKQTKHFVCFFFKKKVVLSARVVKCAVHSSMCYVRHVCIQCWGLK